MLAGTPGAEAIPDAGAAAYVRRTFREVDTPFANLGQGWVSRSRRPPVASRFPDAVPYVRFDRDAPKPKEGRCRRWMIDDVIAAWTRLTVE
jgi:hypothetical protein